MRTTCTDTPGFELTVVTGGSKDLLIHCLKSNQPCTADLGRLKGLYYIVLQERQDPSETSECLTPNTDIKTISRELGQVSNFNQSIN